MPDLWGTSGSVPDDRSGTEPRAQGAEPSGEVVSDQPAPSAPSAPRRRERREPEPLPDWLRSNTRPDRTPPPGRDPVAVAALACGFVGIVFAGLLMALVTAVLGGQAGIRARESGRSYELPYLAFALAFVDGVAWIVQHLLLDVPAWIG